MRCKTGRLEINASADRIVPFPYVSSTVRCVIFCFKGNQYECSFTRRSLLFVSAAYVRIPKLFPGYSWATGHTSVSLLIMVACDSIDRRHVCLICTKYLSNISACSAHLFYISKVKRSWKRSVEKYFLFDGLGNIIN